jgi:hypothetical protein
LTLKLLADTEGFAATPLGKERHNAKRRKHTKRRSKHDPRHPDLPGLILVRFPAAV